MAFYPITDTDGYVWATTSMSTVNDLLAASWPNPAYIAANRQIDKQPTQAEAKSQAGTGLRNETRPTERVGKAIARNIDIDAESQTLIFQTIDENTGSVVSQYPTEIQLSLRAYLAAAQAKSSSQPISFSRTA